MEGRRGEETEFGGDGMRDWMEGEGRASSIRGEEAREGEGRRVEGRRGEESREPVDALRLYLTVSPGKLHYLSY